MSVVIEFPVHGASGRAVREAADDRAASVGDLIVVCVNLRLPLWCAWPVATVADDGWPLAALTPAGVTRALERLAVAGTERRVFRAADHDPERFHDLRWKTSESLQDASAAFAAIRLRGTET